MRCKYCLLKVLLTCTSTCKKDYECEAFHFINFSFIDTLYCCCRYYHLQQYSMWKTFDNNVNIIIGLLF